MVRDSTKKMIRVIADRLKNHKLVTDASIAFKQTSEKAHEKLAYAQNAATQKYNTIVKQVNGATLVQDVNSAPLQPADPLPKQIIVWWKWYQQLTGLDNVEHARRQVIAVQDRLFGCQEKRRQLTQHAAVINNSLSQIYGELIQTKREDPKYVQLTIMENKSLQESKQINEQMGLLEIEEKEYFTQLATAIKEYHDSQTANAMKYKYLSIVASALFAIVSLVGSMIYNNKRIRDVRNVIAHAQEETQNTYITTLGTLQQHINNKFVELSKSSNTPRITQASQTSHDSNVNFSPRNLFTSEDGKTKVITYVIGGFVSYCILKSIFG